MHATGGTSARGYANGTTGNAASGQLSPAGEALALERALQDAIGHDRFARYFAPGSAHLDIRPDRVVISGGNEFYTRWLQQWLSPLMAPVLEAHQQRHAAPARSIEFVVAPHPLQAVPAGASHGASHAYAAHSAHLPGHPQGHPQAGPHDHAGSPAAHAVPAAGWRETAAGPHAAHTIPSGPAVSRHGEPGAAHGVAARGMGSMGGGPAGGAWNAGAATGGGGLTGARWRRGEDARYRLEDFVVGESNRLAYTAACAIAPGHGAPGFRALVLHGPCGLGKTHLLSGVLRRARELDPEARVRYVTAEQFANEFIASVGTSDLPRFRQRYRGLDLLCIDDVHFLAGKQKTMAELEHTFESLDLAGARVVIASDAHPSQIADFSRRLTARLAGAVAVQLHKPDRATRLKIVEKLALERGLLIDPSTVQTIADACVESVREIQGALAKLEALATHAGLQRGENGGRTIINPALARRAVAEDLSGRVTRPIRVNTITEVVCKALHVDMSEVLGNGRHKRVVLARSISAWLARRLTSHSFPEIARHLHRPSHSTIVTQCQKVQRQIDANEPLDAGLEFDGVRIADFCERLRNEVLRRPAD